MSRIALCGLFSVCVLGTVRADDAEDKAAEYFKSNWCDVTRDESQPGKPVTTLILHKAPKNYDLKPLGSFKKPTSLIVLLRDLDEGSLKSIASVDSLEKIEFHQGGVSDEGLKHLVSLPNLKVLV